jgi:quinol monooxygenase YgiN
MPYALGKFKVADYERWKQGFAAGEAIRKAAGSHGALAFRSASDPNEIILLIEWDDLDVGKQVGSSPKVLELQQASGVISPFEPYQEADRFES